MQLCTTPVTITTVAIIIPSATPTTIGKNIMNKRINITNNSKIMF